MDRSPQEPNPLDPPDGPRPAESPLAFPVEVPGPVEPSGPADPEAGTPASVEDFGRGEPEPARPGDALLAFPVEAPRPGPAPSMSPLSVPPPPVAPPSVPSPSMLSDSESPPTEPVPVAILPGSPGAPPTPEPAPEPPEPAAGPPRVLAPILVVLGALLVLGGCFLPLFRIEQHVTPQQTYFTPKLVFTESAWSSEVSAEGNDPIEQPAAPVGIPMVAAVVVLAAASGFAFSGRSGRSGRLGHRLTAVGASFAAGVAATIGMSAFGWSSGLGDEGLDVSLGLGLWLLILGVVFAAGSAVLGYLTPAGPRPAWADPGAAYADTPTPPSGIAITVLPPEDPERR